MADGHLSIPVTVRWAGGDLELETAGGGSVTRVAVAAEFVERFHDAEHRGDRVDPNQPLSTRSSPRELELDCLDRGFELGAFFEPLLAARASAPAGLTRFELRFTGSEPWSVPVELARVCSPGAVGSQVDRLVVVPDVSVARVWNAATEPLRRLLVGGAVRLVGSFVESPGLNVEADRVRFEQAVRAATHQHTDVAVSSVITDGSFSGPDGLCAALGGDTDTPTVVVLSGHGGPGRISFNDQDVDAATLSAALAPADVRAALLAVCSGAQLPSDDRGGLDTARSLVESGVPVVVAMAARIDGRLATEFVDGFLGELLTGETVDAAVREGRRRMDHGLHQGGRLSSWSLPRLVVAARPGARFASGPRPLADEEIRLVPQPAPQPHGGVVRVSNLGAPPALSVGRDDEVGRLVNALSAGQEDRAVVAVFGQRGIGKSFLARRVAEKVDADIVWWIRADDEDSVLDGFDLLHRRLGLPEPSRDDRYARAAVVRDHLTSLERSRSDGLRWLLIFDNVAGGAARDVVERWSPSGGPGAVLATVNGDVDWDHGRLDLRPLSRSDAVELMARQARVAATAVVEQLVDELGGVPLAIVHLGGLMREAWWSPELALERLREQPASALGGVGENARTIAGVVARALAELRSEDRMLFAALCQLDLDAVPAAVMLSPASAKVLGQTPGELHDTFAVFRSLGLVEADRPRGVVRIHRLTSIVTRALLASGAVPSSADPRVITSHRDGERGPGV